MATPSNTLILLDLSAVMAGTTREWQEYSRVGECYLPQVVYEEIQFLCDRAPEPTQETTAREFMRFYPASGWKLTTANGTHPSLTPSNGHSLSKQARLSLATAQCAYGLSLNQPEHLIVFVANSKPLIAQIQALETNNLACITATALLQWCRTGHRPPAVAQMAISTPQTNGQVSRSATNRSQPTPMTGPASAARPLPSKPKGNLLSSLVAGVLALAGLAIAGSIIWAVVQPASFNKFIRQLTPNPTNSPTKPTQKPAQKPPQKPLKKSK